MEQQLKNACPECFTKLKELQKLCHGCGYKIELVTVDEEIERFIKRLSPGGLLWTQAFALGTRQYLWFVLSLLPITGFVALPVMFVFGRRWSWKVGGWNNFDEFKRRQKLMDRIGIAWVLLLVSLYLYFRFVR